MKRNKKEKLNDIPEGWTKQQEDEYQEFLKTWYFLKSQEQRPMRIKPNKRYTPPVRNR